MVFTGASAASSNKCRDEATGRTKSAFVNSDDASLNQISIKTLWICMGEKTPLEEWQSLNDFIFGSFPPQRGKR